MQRQLKLYEAPNFGKDKIYKLESDVRTMYDKLIEAQMLEQEDNSQLQQAKNMLIQVASPHSPLSSSPKASVSKKKQV